jgi:hypothetical protein
MNRPNHGTDGSADAIQGMQNSPEPIMIILIFHPMYGGQSKFTWVPGIG